MSDTEKSRHAQGATAAAPSDNSGFVAGLKSFVWRWVGLFVVFAILFLIINAFEVAFSHTWRERLLGGYESVSATVTTIETKRNPDEKTYKHYTLVHLTWQQDGKIRKGYLDIGSSTAPDRGTKLHVYAGDGPEVSRRGTAHYWLDDLLMVVAAATLFATMRWWLPRRRRAD